MANDKITELLDADLPLDGDEVIEILQDGINKKVSIHQLSQNLTTVLFNTSPTPGAHETGKIYWDADAGTISVMADVADVIFQLAQEFVTNVKNNNGIVIPNMSPVYMLGAIGNRPAVELAQADTLEKADVIVISTAQIGGNQDGVVTLLGLVRDGDTSAWSSGDYLYLSQTVPGAMQNTAPVSGISVKLARVVISHPTNGIIIARQPEIEVLP